MSIADQVDTLEQDHAAALAEIAALNADKAALASANASLQRDLVGLQLEVNDMKHYVDDARAMAEQLAESAMGLLRASRRQVGGQAEVIPFAPTPKTAGQALDAFTSRNTLRQGLRDLIDADPRFNKNIAQNNDPEPPAQQAVTEIMAGDSGDEHKPRAMTDEEYYATDQDQHMTAADIAMLEEQAEVESLPMTDEEQRTDHERFMGRVAADIAERQRQEAAKHAEAVAARNTAPLGFTHCPVCQDPPSCRGECNGKAPTLVQHDKDDLPIFLKPSFEARAERQIFA